MGIIGKRLRKGWTLLGLCLALGTVRAAAGGEKPLFEADFATAESAAKYLRPGAAFVPDAGPDGKGALRIDRGDLDAVMIHVALDRSRAKGRAIQLSALMKADNLGQPRIHYLGPKLMIHLKAPGETSYIDQPKEYGTYDWRPFRVFVRVPDDVRELDLQFGVQSSTGAVYFRDLRVDLVPSVNADGFVKPAAPLQKTPRYRGAMVGDIKADDVRVFAETFGGNLVRWTMVNHAYKKRDIGGREKYLAWLDEEIARLDNVLPAMERYGVKVVIDLHTGPDMEQDSYLRNLLSWEPAAQETLAMAWKKLATHYKGNGNIYGYDLLNEPREQNYVYSPDGGLDWNRLADKVARVVRDIDPDTPIIVEPTKYASPAGFKVFTPIDVPNVIYSVHFYEPHEFTHQGVYRPWTPETYPGTITKREWNIDAIRAELKPVVEFQKKYNVPIFVGEFSAIAWAPGAARYVGDCITVYEENGWDWVYHAFREWPGWSTEHEGEPDANQSAGALKRVATTDRMEVLKKAFARNKNTP